MTTKSVRKTALRPVTITRNELNQLLFWAKVGLRGKAGGTYYPEVLQTIAELDENRRTMAGRLMNNRRLT